MPTDFSSIHVYHWSTSVIVSFRLGTFPYLNLAGRDESASESFFFFIIDKSLDDLDR